MLRRSIVAGLALAVVAGAGQLSAQLPRPLIPLQGEGNRVAPFFDGWYENEDGSISFSFGYSNLNKETVDIPLGPDNVITPKEYDGRQPTTFHVMGPDLADGGGGGGGAGRTPAVSPATAAARAPGRRRRRGRARARSRARGVHGDGAQGLQGRRRLDLEVQRPDLRDPRPLQVHGLPTELAGGDGHDPAAAALRGEGPGRPGPDRHPGAAAASQGRHAGRAADLAHRRRRPRQGADQVRARAAGDERLVVQVHRSRGRWCSSRRRPAFRR